jgi:hypothetical protein
LFVVNLEPKPMAGEISEAFSTSATPTVSFRCLPCRSGKCQTARERVSRSRGAPARRSAAL